MTALTETFRLKAEEDEDELVTALPPFKRYESQGVVRQISFYLSGEIGAPILAAVTLFRTVG